jgi:hypothetical protein
MPQCHMTTLHKVTQLFESLRWLQLLVPTRLTKGPSFYLRASLLKNNWRYQISPLSTTDLNELEQVFSLVSGDYDKTPSRNKRESESCIANFIYFFALNKQRQWLRPICVSDRIFTVNSKKLSTALGESFMTHQYANVLFLYIWRNCTSCYFQISFETLGFKARIL